MTCAEDFLKFLCKFILENCVGEINFFSKRFDKTNADRFQSMISSSYEKISYTQAVDALKQVTNHKFETEVQWGISLTEEHERYMYLYAFADCNCYEGIWEVLRHLNLYCY